MSQRSIRLLLIDDDPVQRSTCKRFLNGDPETDYSFIEAEDSEDALKLISDSAADCVLLDYNLPGTDGLGLLEELQFQDNPDKPPVVMMTGYGSEGVAVRAMKLGCEDYLSKDSVDQESLTRAIRNAIERTEMRRILHQQQDELESTRQQELVLKDEFLSHISHELRTPLTAIHQLVSLLLEEGADPLTNEQRQFLEISARNVQQLRTMIDDLMEVTRARSGKLRVEARPVYLNDLFAEVALVFEGRAREKQIAFEAEIPRELGALVADEGRVRQMLGNLLENALKFTSEEGRVGLRVGPDPTREEMLRVSVWDNGSGIASDVGDKIFFRLQQGQDAEHSSRRGLGLGLFICRELAERQDGEIWVESELGNGSVFHFTLPLFLPSQLLSSALVKDGEMRHEFGRIKVRLRHSAERVSVPRRAGRAALHLLRATVYAGIDVVLAGEFSDSEAEFEIIVGSGLDGVRSLEARLRRQLEGCRELIDTQTDWEIETEVEQVEPDNRPLPERLAELSNRLAAAVAPTLEKERG